MGKTAMEVRDMCMKDFFKGVGAGVVLGAAVGMLAMPKPRKCRTGFSRAMRSLGELVDGISRTVGM